MDRLVFILGTILLFQCSSDYEPAFTGKTIYHDWNSDKLKLNIDGQLKEFKLPTSETIDYNSPIWLRGQDTILMTKTEKTDSCYNYSIVSFDVNGNLQSTILKSEPCTIIEFMPAPNDTLLLLRTYNYADWFSKNKVGRVNYLVYDLFKQSIQDSISFDNTNLELDKFHESIWSPDSKKVLLFATADNGEQLGFIYNLNEGKKLLDSGTNFIWSPTDNDVVSYLKDNEIVFKNLDSNEKDIFYRGQEDKAINNFRWNPTGEFLVINFNGQFLNIDTKATWRPTSILVSVHDKRESKVFERHNVYDSWK